MSQQGPIIVVSTAGRPPFAGALDDAKLFPVIDTVWADAPRAVAQIAARRGSGRDVRGGEAGFARLRNRSPHASPIFR